MKVIYSGIPEEARKLLQRGIDSAYPGLGVELESLSLDLLPVQVMNAVNTPDVIFVVLDSSAERECKEIAEDTLNSEKYLKFEDIPRFRKLLIETLKLSEDVLPEVSVGLNLGLVEGISEENRDKEVGINVYEQIIHNLQAQLKETDLLLQYVDGVDNSSSSEQGILEKSHHQDNPQDEYQLKELKNRIKELNEENEHLKARLNSKELELTDLYGTVSVQESRLDAEKKRYDLLETMENQWNEERVRLQGDLDRVQGTLLRVRSERDALKSENVLLTGEVTQLRDITSGVEKGKTLLEKEFEQLSDKYKRLLEEKTGIQTQYDKLHGEKESLNKRCNDLVEISNQNSMYLKEANEEILELKGKLKGLELSDKGMTEQSRRYSELYETLLKLQGDIFFQIGTNAFPKTLGVLQLENLSNSLSQIGNIGFLVAGNSESQRNVYKYLREELLVVRSGLGSQTKTALINQVSTQRKVLLVDLSTDSSLDYVFQVQGAVKSSLDWWRDGGGVERFVNPTGIRGVDALMMGTQFINDAFLLRVDWERRLKELSESGYTVIFLGINLSNLVGRILFNSIRMVGEVSVGIDGLITNTRNSVINLQGFETDNLNVVITNKTTASSSLYNYLEGVVSSVQYYEMKK